MLSPDSGPPLDQNSQKNDCDTPTLNNLPAWFGRVTFPSHRRDLEASGLTETTWVEAGLGSVSDPKEISALLGWNSPATRLGSCMAIPYFSLAGERLDYVRLRPEKPRRDKKKEGRLCKYESPRGKENRAYFPVLVRQRHHDISLPVIVCEGEKKAIAGAQNGFLVVGLAGVQCWRQKGKKTLLPDLLDITWKGRRAYVAFDSDRSTNPNVLIAESALAAALQHLGADVRVIELPAGPDGAKTGIDDFFVRGGTAEQFRALMTEAKPPKTEVELFAIATPSPITGQQDAKASFIMIGPDEHRMADDAISLMANDPEMFVLGDQLVRVVHGVESPAGSIAKPGGARIAAVSRHTLRERLSLLTWARMTDDGLQKSTPPQPVVNAILDRKSWPGVRVLTGLTEFPVLTMDGSVLEDAGYHAPSGLYHAPRCPVNLTVPASPTIGDANRASAELMSMVADFPFHRSHHASGWLAALLTAVGRHAFHGPTPIFLFDGNRAGTGKTMLAHLVGIVSRGCELPVNTMPSEGEETRKIITTLLIRGDSIILFDNLPGRLGNAELDALLSTTIWNGRVLGESRDVQVPNHAVWMASGNNVAIVADTIRRVCHIRLVTALENPESRDDVRERELMRWAENNRPRLLSCAMVILRAYIVAGRPDMGLTSLGSYPGWSGLIRSAIVWSGMPDPETGRQDLRVSQGDERLVAMAGLVSMWTNIDPHRTGLSCSSVVSRIDAGPQTDGLAETLAVLAGGKPHDGKPDRRAHALGLRFRLHRDQMISGCVFRLIRTDRNGIGLWAAVVAGDEGNAGNVSSHAREATKRHVSSVCPLPHMRADGNIARIPSTPRTEDDDGDSALRSLYDRSSLDALRN